MNTLRSKGAKQRQKKGRGERIGKDDRRKTTYKLRDEKTRQG